MDDLDAQQVTGDLLRRERLRRRLTLAQVAQAIKIREQYLDAIENDSFDELPSPVATIGFIRNYARFLGFEPEPFIQAYKATRGPLPAPEVRPETSRPVYSSRRTTSCLVPVLLLGFVVALVGYLYQQVSAYLAGASFVPPARTDIALTMPTPLPSPPVLPPTPTTTPSPTPVPTLPPTATPTTDALPSLTPTPTPGIRVDAQIAGRVWLQVESDGKVVFTGILLPGDRRTWTGTHSVMLWSGNAANVIVTLNGKPLGPLGPSGKVVKMTWTAPL